MKILFIVSHPTQFEGPFFQFIEKTRPGTMHVLFYDASKFVSTYDEEMKITMNYGIDLKSGYPYTVLPQTDVAFAVKEAIKKSDADLIIVNGYATLALIWSIIYGKRYGKILALRLDTVEFKRPGVVRRTYKSIMYQIFSSIFKHFFVTGTLTRQFLLRHGIADSRMSTFSYVVDNAFFEHRAKIELSMRDKLRDRLHLTTDDYVILAVSKLCPREVPWDVIKVMGTLTEYNSKIHLVVVGDGPSRAEIERYLADNGVHNVRLVGYVQYQDLPQYYALADVFIHAAIDEPWGVSVQEAMASHLPVIVSNGVGAGMDLIQNGKNGFVYAQGDSAEVISCIVKAHETLNRENIKDCNRGILAEWSYENTLETIVKVASSAKG